ncbi:MAG: alkaline phosphatase family protein, partial [Blastocatellia bacterium]|nr:alkaline phosphatase family protein [Blastocatellia bacterium]
MKRSLISLFSLLLLFLIEVRAENGKPYVVVISVDGLHPELYLKSDQLGLKIPTIKRLMQQGSYAEAMETVYPSVTYPSHTTLVTGVRPIAHGIVANLIFVDPKERNQDGSEDWFWHAKAIKTPTLWSEAKKAGLRTAAVGWPVTAEAEIDYLIPEIWRGPFSTTREVGLEYATPEIREKLDAVMPKSEYGLDDEARAAAAEMIIKDYKPNLMLLHFV